MNELISIEYRTLNGVLVSTCNARDLWQFVESKRQFADWIKIRIQKYGFIENQDFLQVVDSSSSQICEAPKSNSYGQQKIDYYLTIGMAKELAMIENNAKGREVRRYFIECERRLHERPQDFSSDLLTIAKATQASADAVQALANTVRALVDKYASHATSELSPNSLTCPHIVNCEQRTQPQLPKPTASTLAITSQAQQCADAAFLTILWESVELQPFTASELHRIILTRQYPQLTDAAIELLGDVTTWTARKLGQVLGRWSRTELSCHRVLNTDTSKNGIVWRLERVS